jgi:hypothetical protein
MPSVFGESCNINTDFIFFNVYIIEMTDIARNTEMKYYLLFEIKH